MAFGSSARIGAFASALDKTQPGFAEAYQKALDTTYYRMRDNSDYPSSFLETIKWARDSSTLSEK